MKLEKYDLSQVERLLIELNQPSKSWCIEDEKLTKDFVFADFNAAFGFMTRVAMLAEKMDHHPEWFNLYNRVRVQLTTHDVQGISYKDADMARYMDELA